MSLDTAWVGQGNSSTTAQNVTFNNLITGKKYLVMVQSTYNSGSFNPAFTGVTVNWSLSTWSNNDYAGSNIYIRNRLYCITASAATITCNSGCNISNSFILASEDSGTL